jgi:hypothetical protein
MTEAEWLACTDRQLLLEFLRGKTSDRKLRLFVCACCRRIWEWLGDKPRGWVGIAEQYADGVVNQQELEKAAAESEKAISCLSGGLATNADAFSATHATLRSLDNTSADVASMLVANAVGHERTRDEKTIRGWDDAWICERATHSRLLRDILGNPFRLVSINRAWQTPTVVALAHAAYENRTLPAGTLDAVRLAILTDALEDAGCDNADILAHGRNGGEHVRGCWVVDLILGKQ